jgi:hypothetical protein
MGELEEAKAAAADLQKQLDAAKKEHEGKVAFTQETLDKMFADRGKQGAQAHETELLKKWGFEKVEDAEAALAEFKKLQDGQKSELEKAQAREAELQKKLDAANAEREEARKQIQDGLMRAAVVSEATRHNFRDDALDDIWLVVDKSKLKVNDASKVLSVVGDKDVEGVADMVKEIAKAKPHWLKAKSGAGGTPRPGGSNSQHGASESDKGAAELTRRQYQSRF